MAQDLREVVAALKISSDIERIGDYAANGAKRTLALVQMPPVQLVHAIPRMGRLVQEQFKEVLEAYVDHDSAKEIRVWERAEEVDAVYTSQFRELLPYTVDDTRKYTPSTSPIILHSEGALEGDE